MPPTDLEKLKLKLLLAINGFIDFTEKYDPKGMSDKYKAEILILKGIVALSDDEEILTNNILYHLNYSTTLTYQKKRSRHRNDLKLAVLTAFMSIHDDIQKDEKYIKKLKNANLSSIEEFKEKFNTEDLSDFTPLTMRKFLCENYNAKIKPMLQDLQKRGNYTDNIHFDDEQKILMCSKNTYDPVRLLMIIKGYTDKYDCTIQNEIDKLKNSDQVDSRQNGFTLEAILDQQFRVIHNCFRVDIISALYQFEKKLTPQTTFITDMFKELVKVDEFGQLKPAAELGEIVANQRERRDTKLTAKDSYYTLSEKEGKEKMAIAYPNDVSLGTATKISQ